jgi:hypothetical protein
MTVLRGAIDGSNVRLQIVIVNIFQRTILC